MMVKLIIQFNFNILSLKVQLVVPNKEVFVRFVARVNPGEGEGGLQVHLQKGFETKINLNVINATMILITPCTVPVNFVLISVLTICLDSETSRMLLM